MPFVRYEEAEVDVGSPTPCRLLAQNVTVGENLPLQAVRSLGYNGAIAAAANGPPDGSWSVTFTMHEADRTSCDEVSATDDKCTPIYCSDDANFPLKLCYNGPSVTSFIMLLAGDTMFIQGMATSFSVTAEPNSIINATLAGNYYDCGINTAPGQIGVAGGSPRDGTADWAVAHGEATDVSVLQGDIGFSCEPFSCTYEASRGLNPIYQLNNLTPSFVMTTDPQQSMTLQGENLPAATTNQTFGICDEAPLCTDMLQLQMDINDFCDGAICTHTVCGVVTSRDIELAVDDVLRGNITITDYAFPQDLTCDVICHAI